MDILSSALTLLVCVVKQLPFWSIASGINKYSIFNLASTKQQWEKGPKADYRPCREIQQRMWNVRNLSPQRAVRLQARRLAAFGQL